MGRVAAEKNVQLLVDSFRLLRRQVPAVRLVLVGQVYHRRWLRRLLGQMAGVVVTGQQPPEVVAEAFAGAEILALPSLTDVQALVQQEAALAGVPTVLTDVGLHTYGPLGGATVLAAPEPVAYAAALRGLLCDPERARVIGIAARNRALEHTPERFAAQVRDVYALAAAQRFSRSA
ncbi:glycosyltransferase family 4 protein [Streptomyces sp. NBC_00988]|uniref:glycosyltransferase family 4 protein n=1 Tax=Streptomyces sp. NBC_00988 TaxID=2903704 RepID=UPI0038634314